MVQKCPITVRGLIEVSKKRSNFRIRQFEKRHFNIAANLTLNTMVSFVILLIARTARIACADRHVLYIQTDRHTHTHTHTHETTTVTLAAHNVFLVHFIFSLLYFYLPMPYGPCS